MDRLRLALGAGMAFAFFSADAHAVTARFDFNAG